MPEITAAFVELIKRDTDIAALTGGRVSANSLPQNDPIPAIVVEIQSENAPDAIDGPLGMDQPIIRCFCYAAARVAANDLRLAVRDHVGGFFGVVSGVFIKSIAQASIGQRSATDRPARGTDQLRFVTYQDFLVTYDSVD